MKKRIKFIIPSLFIILTRSYDVYATYQHTPDLKKEANPLASVLSMGWTPILLIVGILTLGIIYLYYKATFKPYNLLPTQKGYNFSQLTTYVYLGKVAHWTAMFYKLPQNGKRLQQYLGQVLTRAIVYAGIVSTVMWLLIRHASFYKPYHSAGAVYTVLIGGIILITVQYHIQLYRRYQLATSTE